jgi:hypothetical protein
VSSVLTVGVLSIAVSGQGRVVDQLGLAISDPAGEGGGGLPGLRFFGGGFAFGQTLTLKNGFGAKDPQNPAFHRHSKKVQISKQLGT